MITNKEEAELIVKETLCRISNELVNLQYRFSELIRSELREQLREFTSSAERISLASRKGTKP